MSIGKNIKQIRNEHNLTQKQLAKIAGVTDKAVSMWEMEKREPRMGAIQKIADFLGVSKSKIIDEPPLCYSICQQDLLDSNLFIPIDEFSINHYNIDSKNDFHPSKTYHLLQSSDNMAPFILKNDKLIIEQTEEIKNNSCYAIIVDSQTACINRIVLCEDSIELISDNPYFPKRVFSSYERKRLQFIGKVKKIIREL